MVSDGRARFPPLILVVDDVFIFSWFHVDPCFIFQFTFLCMSEHKDSFSGNENHHLPHSFFSFAGVAGFCLMDLEENTCVVVV